MKVGRRVTPNEIYREGWRARDAEVAALRAEIKSTAFTYCAYCGAEFPSDGEKASEAVSAHIHSCPKHPIAALKAEAAELQALAERLLFSAREIVAVMPPNSPFVKACAAVRKWLAEHKGGTK